MGFKVWEYERGEELLRAARLVEVGGLEPHDFEIELLSPLGEHVDVMIVSGALTDRTSILHVESRGAFEIVRLAPWAERGRFLTLRRWPGEG